jgi:hypothetical protein
MERETKSLETKVGKHKVEIKTYLTERENRELIKVLSPTIKMEDGSVKNEANTETFLAYQDKLIEVWIVSVDGKKEGIKEEMLEWRKADFKEVIDFISANDKDTEKKTN